MNDLDLTFATATEADAGSIAALRNAAADDLTRRYGQGHWSSTSTERGVLRNVARPKFSRTSLRVMEIRSSPLFACRPKSPGPSARRTSRR